ncbi:DUF3159 domain-containing protein [Nocardia niigatensis]
MSGTGHGRTDLKDAWSKFLEHHGPRHIADGAAPAVGFLLGYQLLDPWIGIAAALAVAVALGGHRVARGDSAKVVGGSIAVVALYSVFVLCTGRGRDFYLPDLARLRPALGGLRRQPARAPPAQSVVRGLVAAFRRYAQTMLSRPE